MIDSRIVFFSVYNIYKSRIRYSESADLKEAREKVERM